MRPWWMVWPQQADKFANVVSDLANNAHLHLRGFATNVANYQHRHRLPDERL